MGGSMAEGLWMPSRSVSSSTTALASSPGQPAPFQSWKRSGTARILRGLEEQRDALAPADTRRADTSPDAAPSHLVQEVRRDARARRGERMSHRDGAAVHVGLLARQ